MGTGAWRALIRAGLLVILFSDGVTAARADTPAPGPSPSATASPQPGSIRTRVDAHLTFISQGESGPGQAPLEGPGFAAGSPLSPLTPYDTFSSAPLIPGNAGESALVVTPTFFGRGFDASATFAAQLVSGSVTNATYWGESLIPSINPHLGATHLPYAIVFPTHAGADDSTGFVASVLSGSIATKDGNVRLRGGWFDLAQSDGFVFAQPAYTSAIPAVAVLPAESLGNGPPNADWWTFANGVYPLHGVDLVGKNGPATAELTDAALPSLPGTGARLTMGSLVVDHGEGTRYSAQVLHVATGGAPVTTTILFGIGTLLATPQGPLPSTVIGGQSETMFGVRGAFHVLHGLDAVAEYGHSTYTAQNVALPGTGRPGNYEHAGLTRPQGRASLAFDWYRNDPYYATAILPYGIPENVWSVAWSWPGQWLKSNYQLINNAPVNVDRQGYRVKYQLGGGPLEVRASYANFGEIVPITLTNAQQTGFVDGFFLPQSDPNATLGRQRQYALWTTWHAPLADFTVDYTEDTMHRAALPAGPQDLVSYDTPEYSLYASRKFGSGTLVSAGYARYGMRGSFGQPYTNIDFAQHEWFAGAEFRQSVALSTLVTVRRAWFNGFPSQAGGPPPDFAATLLVIEQRLHL